MCRLRYRQFPGGELPLDHPAPMRLSPQQGCFRARRLVHASSGLARSAILHGPLRCVGYCKFRRAPDQSFSFLNVDNAPQQQRVRQAVLSLHRAVAAHPRPLHEARCCHLHRCHPHQRFQQGRRTRSCGERVCALWRAHFHFFLCRILALRLICSWENKKPSRRITFTVKVSIRNAVYGDVRDRHTEDDYEKVCLVLKQDVGQRIAEEAALLGMLAVGGVIRVGRSECTLCFQQCIFCFVWSCDFSERRKSHDVFSTFLELIRHMQTSFESKHLHNRQFFTCLLDQFVFLLEHLSVGVD